MGKEAEIMGEEGCRCSNGVCQFISRKRLSDDIMPHILILYAASATPRDFEIYAPNASFEDPLMCALGWDKKPLWNRETFRLPLIGRVFEVIQRGSILATHAMMGFGKDPTM